MLPSGRSVCKFGLAINRNFKDAEGNRREETTFIDVESFGPRGEALSRFFSKGKPIFVEGRLKLDQWESQTGEKRSKLLVDLENWEFMGAKQDSYEGQSVAPTAGASQPQATRVAPDNGNATPDSPSPSASDPDLNEDVPF
jgi:single-strand DNA-binding protein